MTWYYKIGDQELGPVSKAELESLIKAKTVIGHTLVRSVKMKTWRPLAEVVRAGQRSSQYSSAMDHTHTIPPMDVSKPPPPPGGLPPGGTGTRKLVPSSKSGRIDFQFKGKGSEYFKIWLVNVLLSILTLGIYSAWAKVRRKQYFYGNTRIADSGFRYLANPVKILKGRLIVFVLFVAYSIVSELLPPIGLAFTLMFLIALPWLVVRSLAFNARNSSLREIRFDFVGTYGQAAKAFILWPLLAIVTLGILGPYAYFQQKRFVVEHAGYGRTLFTFTARPKDYYILVVLFTIPAIITLALAGAASLFFPPAIGLFIAVLYLYGFAYFTVKSTNLLFNSTRLAGHGFEATMRIRDFALIVLTNTLATVVTLGLFHPFARVRAYRYRISKLALKPEGDLDQFVAAEKKHVSALGDELTDFMDFDFGF